MTIVEPTNLTKGDRSIIQRWKKLGFIQTDEDIIHKHQELYDKIINLKLTNVTIKFNLLPLKKYLLSNNKHDFAQFVAKKMNEITVQHKAKTLQHKLTKKEEVNYVSYEQLIEYREELKEEFTKNPSDRRTNLAYLLLALMIETPLRIEYYNIAIISNEPTDKNQNYILKHTDTSYEVIINIDKVSQFKGSSRFLLSTETSRAITHSLRVFPRKYLLSTNTDGNKPLLSAGATQLYKYIFQDTGRIPSATLIRKAVVTHHHKTMTDEQKRELAYKMRHSEFTAGLDYNKSKAEMDDVKQRIERILYEALVFMRNELHRLLSR